MSKSLLVLAVFSALACISVSAGDAWPWQQWCHDVSAKTYNMCTTQTRGDLPTVASQGKFEVSWVRRLIGVSDPTQLKIATKAKFWHSAIVIKDLDSAMIVLVQYETLNFSPSMFFPLVNYSLREIDWDNLAVVGWFPEVNQSEWTHTIKMGVVSGTVLNKWFDWVPVWGAKHPHYTQFAVWQNAGMFPTLRKKFESFQDSCCHRFTEDGLGAFHAAGADFSAMQQPVCRNYFVLIEADSREMTSVNRSDPTQWNRVLDFFDGAQQLVGQKIGTPTQMVTTFLGLVRKYGMVTYLADSDLSNYHLVHLSAPYLTYLIQRMILPWQEGGNPHECWSQENISMPRAVQELYVGNQSIVV